LARFVGARAPLLDLSQLVLQPVAAVGQPVR
jgi:hypothetical protein